VKDRHIFLPLEHQLWEMVEKYYWEGERPANATSALLQKFYWWLDDTMEKGETIWELVLKFVYHELYQKVWDSDKKEWVRG
jgi:hypothetical protein